MPGHECLPGHFRWQIGPLLAILLLAGCANAPDQPPLPTPAPRMQRMPALALLRYARRLADTTADGREAAVRAARAQVNRSPGAIAYADLALALATPRQRLYTPDEAARYAAKALSARDAPWDPDARQYLSDMQRLLHAASVRDTHDARTIATLRQQLAAARDKIQALSRIETQLDDRPSP